jgi:hypothetical protein
MVGEHGGVGLGEAEREQLWKDVLSPHARRREGEAW